MHQKQALRATPSSAAAIPLRRRAIWYTAAGCMYGFDTRRARAQDAQLLSPRLESASLTPLLGGVDSVTGDLRYPPWLAGTWRVTATTAGFQMPLGRRFVDDALVAEARKDTRVLYEYRFTEAPAPDGWPGLSVRQDRRFNAVNEENAFISSGGFRVERGRYTSDGQSPHGRVLLDILDTDVASGLVDKTPSTESATYEKRVMFRFQSELDILWAAWEEASDPAGAFVTSEVTVQRQLLPTAGGTASEDVDTSYLELLTRFERPASLALSERPMSVRARYRVTQYLSLPGVPLPTRATRAARSLAKQAEDRAVSIIDYDLLMERISDA